MSKSKGKILLHYKGVILYDTIGDLIVELKEKMFEQHIKQTTYKKVLMVMIEALENVLKYHEHFENEKEIINSYPPEISISNSENIYLISISNPIRKVDVASLQNRLSEVSVLNKQEIKQKYKEIITNGEFSEKGGAGLGIIEMARMSGAKLDFSFSKINDKFLNYSLHINIKST